MTGPAEVSLTTAERSRLYNSARFRAWVRLQKMHPEDYERLFAEEQQLGPVQGRYAGVPVPAPRPRVVDQPIAAKIVRLHNEGWKPRHIAEHLGEGWTGKRVSDVLHNRRRRDRRVRGAVR